MATAPSTTTVMTPTTTATSRLHFSSESTRDSNTTSDYRIGGSTPSPHLPLREKSSQTLRLRRSSPRLPSTSSILNNETTRLPGSDTLGAGRIGTSSSSGATNDRTGWASRVSSREWENPSIHIQKMRPDSDSGDGDTLSSRLLRTTTSIPDYSTLAAAYRNTSSPLPRTDLASQDRSNHLSLPRDPQSYRSDTTPNSVRESVRSALTNGSSAADVSGTERNSVITDRSSTSEVGNHRSNGPLVDRTDTSIEDAIAMYAEGFVDDPVVDNPALQVSGKPFTSSPLALPPHKHTPSTKNNTAGFAPPLALSQPYAHARASISAQSNIGTSTLSASDRNDVATPVQDRLKALIGPPRDRYGFKRESQYIKLAQYDAWNMTYTKYLERRRKKWMALMKQHKLPTDNPTRFPPRSDKVKRYIRKGIPPDWRGQAWFFYAGGPARLAKHPGLYQSLLVRADQGSLTEGDRDHIERDLFRTFPDHIKFKPDESPPAKDSAGNPVPNANHQVETPMIVALRRVLQAFAVHEPKIGYCQSLNFLAGYSLILLSGDEEKAFHLLCILTSVHLPGTHGVSLEGANIDIGVFMLCLRDAMPSLWTEKIDDRADTTIQLAAGDMRVSTGLPTVSLATTGWFMSAFAATLPVETTCRVWDCLFYEGSKTLFRVGLAIFKLSEREIKRTGDEPMEVFQVVQTAPRGMIDANLLIETATKKSSGWSFGGGGGPAGFGGLSQRVVEKRREEKRGLYKVERERVLMKALTAPVDEGLLLEGKGKRNLDRKRVKRFVSLRGK